MNLRTLSRGLVLALLVSPMPALAQVPLDQALAAAGRFSIYLGLQEVAGATQGQQIALPKGAAVASATQGQQVAVPTAGAAVAGATQGQLPSKDPVSATQGQRTFLVPNDAAFAKMPADVLAALRKDPERARAFLRLHTMPMLVRVQDMFEDKPTSYKAFESTQGYVLGFQCNGHAGMHYPRVSVDAVSESVAGAEEASKFKAAAQMRSRMAKDRGKARIGDFQDVAVAGGVAHELDAVLSTGGQYEFGGQSTN